MRRRRARAERTHRAGPRDRSRPRRRSSSSGAGARGASSAPPSTRSPRTSASPGAQVGVLLRNRPAHVGLLLGVLRGRRLRRRDQPRPGHRAHARRPRRARPRRRRRAVSATSSRSSAPTPRSTTARRRRPRRTARRDAPSRAASGRSGARRRGADAHERHDRAAEADRPHLRHARAGARRRQALRVATRTTDVRLRTGVAIVNSPLVHLGGLFRVLQCVNDGRVVLAARALRPSTSGSTPSAATARRPRASCPPRCAWCSRPTSIPPTSRSLRSVDLAAPHRSPPTTPTRSRRSTASPCSSSYAATEFGGSVAGWNLADHREFWATKRGSVGRAHAGCELRVVDAERRRAAARRRGGPARGQGRSARRTTSGSAPPTSPGSTPTASSGSSAGPTRRSSAAGSRSAPTTCGPRSNAIPRVRGAAVIGVPDRAARLRCPSPRSSSGPGREAVTARRPHRRSPPACWRATSSRRDPDRRASCRAPRRPRSTSPRCARSSPIADTRDGELTVDLRYTRRRRSVPAEVRAWLGREVPRHGPPPPPGDWPAGAPTTRRGNASSSTAATPAWPGRPSSAAAGCRSPSSSCTSRSTRAPTRRTSA